MKEFIRKYEDRIHGVLSCFDRVIFRGYLPLMSGWAMAEFLYRLNQNRSSLRPFLLQNSTRVKNHAIAMAKQHDGPFNTSHPTSTKRRLPNNSPSAMESSTAWSVSTPSWNRVARSRLCSTSRVRISGHSFDLQSENVYTSISTSWIAISASSMCAFKPGFPCRSKST